MNYTEADLKSKTVKDLKEIARELGAPAGGRKEELINSILEAAAQAPPAGDELDDPALADVVDDLTGDPAAEEAAAGGGVAAAAADGGKHASIVFALETKEAGPKKANIVGVKTLSDTERTQLRAAKFGLATKGGVSKAAAGGKASAAGISAGGVGVGLEEEIKKLQRAEKFGKLSEADAKKLQGLQRKLEAQKQKQQLALDKVEMAEPDKMKEREKRFGFSLLKEAKDPKDPELMKKRAEKFGKVIGVASVDDDARKKARLERFANAK